MRDFLSVRSCMIHPQMRKSAFWAVLTLGVLAQCLPGQETSSLKNFTTVKNLVPEIDFYVASRADALPFQNRLTEARERLVSFLGAELPKGAVVVCNTLAQKDSVSEARMLKMGYHWALIQVSPDVSAQQMLENIKARMGGQIPPQILERIKSGDMKASGMNRMVDSTVQGYAAAVLMTLLAPEKEFRASRIEDMGRTPLEDWLDIALVATASGTTRSNLRFLQDHLDEAFPLEDIVGGMARPFVAPSTGSSGGQGQFGGGRMGGGMRGGGAPDAGGGGFSGGGRGGMGGGSMSKDVQDRMLFDLQSGSFFDFLTEKIGLDKVKALVKWNREGKKTRDYIFKETPLGSDIYKIENDWMQWVKAQKTEPSNRPNGGRGFQTMAQ